MFLEKNWKKKTKSICSSVDRRGQSGWTELKRFILNIDLLQRLPDCIWNWQQHEGGEKKQYIIDMSFSWNVVNSKTNISEMWSDSQTKQEMEGRKWILMRWHVRIKYDAGRCIYTVI